MKQIFSLRLLAYTGALFLITLVPIQVSIAQTYYENYSNWSSDVFLYENDNGEWIEMFMHDDSENAPEYTVHSNWDNEWDNEWNDPLPVWNWPEVWDTNVDDYQSNWTANLNGFATNWHSDVDEWSIDWQDSFPTWQPDEIDWDWDEDTDEFEVPEACMLTAEELDEITNFPPGHGPIIAFGDSLTAGVGASLNQDYVSELERLTGENIINAGRSGDTTTEALNRLEEDVLSYNPSTVIVWLGGNDLLARYYEEIRERAEDESFFEELLSLIEELFGKVPDDDAITQTETFNNIEEIVERIQATGAVVVLVGMDGAPLDANLNSEYQEVANDTGAIYIPDVLDDIIGRSALTSDFIHPNNAGYELVAERIYAGVACVL